MTNTMCHETDEALMLRVQARDRLAFAALVARHSGKLYGMAYRALYNSSDAEDVVQEAFVKLWQESERWDAQHGSQFTSWFYRIVMNACRDHQRKLRPDMLADSYDVPDDTSGLHAKMQQEKQYIAIENAVKGLPERQKWAVNLCFYQGLSNQEAADIMGLSHKAVESLLMRGKAKLKQLLRKNGGENHAA